MPGLKIWLPLCKEAENEHLGGWEQGGETPIANGHYIFNFVNNNKTHACGYRSSDEEKLRVTKAAAFLSNPNPPPRKMFF